MKKKKMYVFIKNKNIKCSWKGKCSGKCYKMIAFYFFKNTKLNKKFCFNFLIKYKY